MSREDIGDVEVRHAEGTCRLFFCLASFSEYKACGCQIDARFRRSVKKYANRLVRARAF